MQQNTEMKMLQKSLLVELGSDTRHNTIDWGWEPIEISLEFDPDAAEPVSDIRHRVTKQEWVQTGIPLEFDSDTSELAPDITEYTIKLKQVYNCYEN
jgi:hypothetical protein